MLVFLETLFAIKAFLKKNMTYKTHVISATLKCLLFSINIQVLLFFSTVLLLVIIEEHLKALLMQCTTKDL